MGEANGKPRVGIFGLTGCAGDQLVILNCEDELLDLLSLIDVRDFLMASSANDEECHLDIALVDGAVVSQRDEEMLRRIRERASVLVAIGTCAVWGGIATMDRELDRPETIREIYGEVGNELDAQPARALHEVVDVDMNISGCPIEKEQILFAISCLLNGDAAALPEYAVCAECKMNEYECLLTDYGTPCLGPLTAGGCDARCPKVGIACVGCRGPARDANFDSALALYEEMGIGREAIARKLRTFAPIPERISI